MAEASETLTLWDRPIVDPNPFHVLLAHQLVLEQHAVLPPPTGDLPRRPGPAPRHPGDSSAPRFEKGLWEIARRYRDRYVLPRTLSAESAVILQRARAASAAILDAPANAWQRIAGDPANEIGRYDLPERLWQLARELSAAQATDGIDLVAAHEPFLAKLERLAFQSFEDGFGDATTIEFIKVDRVDIQEARPPAVIDPPPRQEWPVVTERLQCDCGRTGTWLLFFADDSAAFGCRCGRLRWEPRVTRARFKQMRPEVEMEDLRSGFDLDSLAADQGYGPFRHIW
ncbi:hypothetical protein ACFVH7_17995 [Kitasatospora indigofera]|uniref:hypothetical protein n=1 Tax=Kitasatospora indigofera TaxID=67307 RepID=UPI00362A276F